MHRTGIVFSALLLGVAAPLALAQSGCMNGIVETQGGTTGNITICSAIVTQAPELRQRLADVQKIVGAQQQQLQQLIKMIRDMNAVSGGLALRQQTELLRNVLTRLGDPQRTTPDQLNTRASSLSGHFQEVSLELTPVLMNQQGPPRVAAALRGEAGDALARLDFETVTEQLSAIQQQLSKIGNEVSAVHEQTTDIQQRMREQDAEAAKRRQLADEETKKALLARETDPNTFAILGMQAITGHTFVYVGHPGVTPFSGVVPSPFSDPTLRLVFRDQNGRRHLERVVDRQLSTPELWRYDHDPYGTSVTVCFAARDPIDKAISRQVTQHFNIQPSTGRTALIPAGDPTLTRADETSCDGVTDSNSDKNFLGNSPAVEQSARPSLPTSAPRRDPMVESIVAHPDYFVTLILNAYRPPGPKSQWHVIVSGGGHDLTDTSLQVVFTHIRNDRRVDLPVPKVIDTLFKGGDVPVPELGDEATVCFFARREGFPDRMMLRRKYDLQLRSAGNIADFQAASVATLTVDTGSPCK